ncbi:tetratricopeptide repeat-containing sensor histidine kinase [Tenacibaculum xiamenense]|uniref:tetratricopeptide repeat-containing sensor histidine kinase n=1 Tax=Tenacibaculum xiamenense TaxID=1261553 RepID=UPI0038942D64
MYKLGFIFFYLFFNTVATFSQKELVRNDSLINSFLEKDFNSFFEVQKFFRKKKLTSEDRHYLLEQSIKNKNNYGKIYAYNSIGRESRNKTLYKESIENHIRALEISRAIKEVPAEIISLNLIGVVYRRQDKIRSALNYHQYALELSNKYEGNPEDIMRSKSISENSIGNIYLTLKQYKLALEKFEVAIVTQKELNDKRGLAINYQNMGTAFQNLGDLDNALENYNLSLKYNEETDSNLGRVICHNSISNVLLIKGEYLKAYETINQVKPLVDVLGNNYYVSAVYNTLGYCQVKLLRLKEAQVNIKKALFTGLKYGIPAHVNKSYEYLSEIYKLEEDYKHAYIFYKKAIEGERKTFNDRNVLYVNNLINKYDNEVKNNKIKGLAKENEITKLKLTRNRNVLIIALVSIALFGVLLYAIYGQRLLNDEKKILMLEQEALQSQMNPHFVFNALNSIKLYIIKNEQKNAVYYLNKFSKLIRSILESSKTKEVSLSEELKTMTLYMSIENIRFSNEIDYEESVDEGMNTEKVKIPPLILQPFLENAIWHGLSSKKGEKLVTLKVKKHSEDYYQIDIEDNGVGRDQALKIKTSKSLKRKSIGIELTKQRLRNFADGFQNNYSLVYTDLVNKKGEPKGTRVTLKIPLR